MKLIDIYNTIVEQEQPKETMQFWHGGNLDDYNEIIAQKNGRYEYGPGLYLITKLSVAEKYSKGSRKLYHVKVEKGNDIYDSLLDVSVVHEFVKNYVIGSLRKEVLQRILNHTKDGKIKAFIFNNIILNNKAIKSTKTQNLRQFYVDNNIDYEIVDNAFGFGEKMMVLYNMKKIVKATPTKSPYDIGDLD